MISTTPIVTLLKKPAFLIVSASSGASLPFVLDESALIAWPVALFVIGLALWVDRKFIRADSTHKGLKVVQVQLHAVVLVLRAVARKSGVDDETMKELDKL